MKELSWYYMLFDSRKTMEMIPPETLKKVLLQMFDYAATGEYPEGMSEIENIAFCGLKRGAELAREHFTNNQERGRKGMESRWHKTSSETPQNAPEQPKPKEPIKSTIEAEKPKRSVFKPPTVEEVQAYCKSRNNGIDAEAFIAFYDSKGWMIGKEKMKRWQSAVITWEKRRKEKEAERRKGDVANDRTDYPTDDIADFIRYREASECGKKA